MHDPYFSAPIDSGDMPHLKPGDIVLLDGNGLIEQLVDSAAVGFFENLYQGALNLLNWASGYQQQPPFEGSPYGSHLVQIMVATWRDPTIVFHYSVTNSFDATLVLQKRTQKEAAAGESGLVTIMYR